MEDKHNHTLGDGHAIESESFADAHLLNLPKGINAKTLRAVLPLLIVAASRNERVAVTMHHLHALPISKVAKALKVPEAQANQILRSVNRRLDTARGIAAREATLQRMFAGPKKQSNSTKGTNEN